MWIGFRNTTAGAVSNPAFRVWWSGFRTTFSDRFRKHIDDMIAGTPLQKNHVNVSVNCDNTAGDLGTLTFEQ